MNSDTVYLGIINRQIILETRLWRLEHVLEINNFRLLKNLIDRTKIRLVTITWWPSNDVVSGDERINTVSSCPLPGRGLKGPQHAWLNTLKDMASNQCQ